MSEQMDLFREEGAAPTPKQLSAESKATFESSGQGETLRRAVLSYLYKQSEPKACFEIEAAINKEVQHTGVLVELKRAGLITVSATRVKVNPKSGRRVGVYSLSRSPFKGLREIR